jgi:hypothetical protein
MYLWKCRSLRKIRTNNSSSNNWSHDAIMSSCIGWLFDIYIEHDQAVLWIKTTDRHILKLIDTYQPIFYILPRNESDGLQLFQILSQQDMVVKVKWEDDKLTNLFDRNRTKEK